MEIMRGGDLFDRIVRKEVFTEAEARHVVRGMARALAYCHACGIVHRDLKVRDSPVSLSDGSLLTATNGDTVVCLSMPILSTMLPHRCTITAGERAAGRAGGRCPHQGGGLRVGEGH